MNANSSVSSIVDDYANLRSIPAVLTAVFALASLYQFGGIATVELTWLGGSTPYQLTAGHATIVSLATYTVAFASSRTKDLEYYEGWEMILIAAGPAVILGHQYTQEVTDLLLQLGDPLGYQLAFLLTIASWGAAVR
jgi:hypothetical protein